MDNVITVLVTDDMISHNFIGIIALAIVVVSLVTATSILAYKAVKKQRKEEAENDK